MWRSESPSLSGHPPLPHHLTPDPHHCLRAILPLPPPGNHPPITDHRGVHSGLPMTRALCLFVLLSPLCCMLSACKSAPQAVEYARLYPFETPVAKETLDVQVFRRTFSIQLTNTTARAFGPSTLWLNRRYSLPIAGLAISETLDLPLKSFRDEFSETFRGGGFFATEAPETLVMAELETLDDSGTKIIYGFVVIKGRAE